MSRYKSYTIIGRIKNIFIFSFTQLTAHTSDSHWAVGINCMNR